MATAKYIKEIVISFLPLIPRRVSEQELRSMEVMYGAAFHNYSNKQIAGAIQRYTEENDFYPPKPKDLISKIQDSEKIKNDEFLVKRFTCSRCHQKVSAISEGECLDCRGFPGIEKNRVQLPEQDEQDYRIEGRMKCQQCGKIGMCIKEPIKTGSWRCRECYSGLTTKEIVNRFKDLRLMMGDEEYKLSWHEEAPF